MSKKPVKERVKEKVKAVKKRVKGKVKAAIALFGVMLFMVGCSTATPASRATTAGYEITVKVSMDEGVKSSTVNIPFTFGDGALASADSAGSTETQTATPTLDIKPDVNLNYAQGGGISNRSTGGAGAAAETGGASGIIEKLTATLTDEGLAALKSAIANKTNGTVSLQKKDGSTVTAECKDGTCTFSDGTTVTAADCASCTDCTPAAK